MARFVLGLGALFWALFAPTARAQGGGTPPYLDTNLTPEQRAADLVSRMTLAEKATQMQNNSAAVPRLNVPAYQWWSEALHGVINEGVTEYPEPIGLAATFDAPGNDVIQSEPIEARDIFFYAMLRPLGLERGKPFKPDARQTKILTDAALVGEAMAKANSADRRFEDGRYRSDAHWDFALRLDADDPDKFWNLVDERASWFYEAVGAGPAMAPKRPGPSSAYLSAYKDKASQWLDGGALYRLRLFRI